MLYGRNDVHQAVAGAGVTFRPAVGTVCYIAGGAGHYTSLPGKTRVRLLVTCDESDLTCAQLQVQTLPTMRMTVLA